MEQETQRCFIALDLSREVINEIKKIQKLIGKQVLFNGKFTEPENLHLTLKFLGDLDNDQIKEIDDRLRSINFNKFEVELGEAGVFAKNYIRIIWIHLKGAEKLQKEIDDKLSDLFEKERRFMSHITIARVKGVADRNALINYLESVKPSKLKFKVDRFFLRKSELKPDGPVYSDLRKYKLV